MTDPVARAISGFPDEGFVDIGGEAFYAIPDVDRLKPFLMSIVGDSDHWMFLSSSGGLTAGRRDATLALFPYETDDRLHRSGGSTGPVTAIRLPGQAQVWRPSLGRVSVGNRRCLFKSVVGNQVVFEEIHSAAGLSFRYRWSLSDRFGFIRTSTVTNIGEESVAAEIVDGIVNLLPFGLDPGLYSRMSNLTNAYKRSEVADPAARLAVYSLEARIVDRPEPAEALMATVAWAVGFPDAQLTVDSEAIGAFEAGAPLVASTLATGRPGSFLLAGTVTLDPGESTSWQIVADVGHTQSDVVGLRRLLGSGEDLAGAITTSVDQGTAGLVETAARSDALQHTGDRVASVHHFANTVFNTMRGGVFMSGYRVPTEDLAAFLTTRNRVVAERNRPWLDSLPTFIDLDALSEGAAASADQQLMRLVPEYLPLSFSRRHGDPSRPWNTFSIRVRDEAGDPVIHYEGNWRDIFQNWEALCVSYPRYLPSLVSVFVNASTFDGFNPYRITRVGIDWEVPDPDDPWSHIGYWGDHQIVYLSRLLEATRRYLPGEVERMLGDARFSYADIPYDLAEYEEIVRDPKNTIRFDAERAAAIARRVEAIGSDGKLMDDGEGQVHLVTLLEKLLVPALSKLSNLVPGGGIWMNTQRPEWNDANNALVGHGLSMVTLCHLRRYLQLLASIVTDSGIDGFAISTEVAAWLDAVVAVLCGDAYGDAATSDASRAEVVDALGRSFEDYRSGVYEEGFSGITDIDTETVLELCEAAIGHLDETVRLNRRSDGLYHSYNLVRFADDRSAVAVEHLYEMLEGQVAVISSGVLTVEERADLLDSLNGSAMYRADQRSFMLYPARSLPSFLEKNVIDREVIEENPLLRALTESGDVSLVEEDPDGRHRFNAAFANRDDLQTALDLLAGDPAWRRLTEQHQMAVLDIYEDVFRHHSFTGRSGSMYGYEGIGSIYWHMVAKLLVAVQETVLEAVESGASSQTIANLVEAYEQVRGGLGFNKSAAEYGAFPTDPYSHTPAHAGAQQPGMTGQVKEEMLTRPLELGVRVEAGCIVSDPTLLQDSELLAAPERWEYLDVEGRRKVLELPDGSLALTMCQVPLVISTASDRPVIEIDYTDGRRRVVEGWRLDRTASRSVFDRSGEIQCLRFALPR